MTLRPSGAMTLRPSRAYILVFMFFSFFLATFWKLQRAPRHHAIWRSLIFPVSTYLLENSRFANCMSSSSGCRYPFGQRKAQRDRNRNGKPLKQGCPHTQGQYLSNTSLTLASLKDRQREAFWRITARIGKLPCQTSFLGFFICFEGVQVWETKTQFHSYTAWNFESYRAKTSYKFPSFLGF